MKRVIILVALSGLVFSVGCAKLKDLLNIDKDFNYSQTVSVPQTQVWDTSINGALPSTGISVSVPENPLAFATNSATYISQYKTASDLIIAVKLKQLSIDYVTPTGANFDMMDTVQLMLSATGLPETMVAYKNGVPKGLSHLELDTAANLDLKEYFKKDSVFVKIYGHFNALPLPNSSFSVNTTLNMLANPLNE